MTNDEEQSSLPAETPDDVLGEKGSPDEETGEPFLAEEDLEGVPPEQRQTIMRAFASVTGFAGPVFNPILRRVNSGHIDKVLEHVEQSSVRANDSAASERRYQFAYTIVGLAALVFLVVFFRDDPDILIPIVSAAAGFAGGFGIGRFRR